MIPFNTYIIFSSPFPYLQVPLYKLSLPIIDFENISGSTLNSSYSSRYALSPHFVSRRNPNFASTLFICDSLLRILFRDGVP